MSKRYYTYILSNKNDTTLYVGVTNDLERRVAEHRSGMIPGFTQLYSCHKLVYFEEYTDVLHGRGQYLASTQRCHVPVPRQQIKPYIMTQDERWNLRYQEVIDFIEINHRNPSKHRIEKKNNNT